MLPYQYRPLDTTTNELRLVTLLPDLVDKPLRLNITHTQFKLLQPTERPPPRQGLDEIRRTLPEGWDVDEALEGRLLFFRPGKLESSVSWQHPDPLYAKEFADDAGNALRCLRLPDGPRTLWIDAICINQTDLGERSAQVGRMCDVYSLASRVIIWLGPAADDSTLAVTSLGRLGAQVEYLRGGLMCPSPGCTQPNWYKSDYEIPFDLATWESIHRLISRPWFTRLWIIQEAQLASEKSVVQCGGDQVPWPVLRRAIICLFLKKSGPPTGMVRQLRYAMDCTQFLRGMSVDRLLQMSSFRACSDPRDKIYGMLSVMPPNFTARIRADYSLSVEAVYSDVFLSYTRHFKRLTLLQQCSRIDAAWPSWVPFWKEPLNVMNTTDRAFRASGLSSAHFQQRGSTLQVVNARFGDVLTAEEVHLGPDPSLQDIINYLSQMGIERLDSSRYVAGGSVYDAYLQSLSAAALQDRFEQPSVYSTLQEWKDEIAELRNAPRGAVKLSRQTIAVLGNLRTHSVVTLEGGYVGLAKRAVQAGDRIAIILGCAVPMALRPTSTGAFQVLGPCFVHGIMDGEALLGPLPSGWTVKASYGEDGLLRPVYHNSHTDTACVDDPRLDSRALPSHWEPIEWTRTRDDPIACTKYRNGTTGEEINCDPRLLPDALSARGVRCEAIDLI
ncbi:uncharacterized protein NECHADRAFT_98482 [Fusarium vanettenii 77-13-4]|uniref:WW domain-containing protein n=1 Tax=Fusarium vanettenii (strain ATCC MYA-4622 / CBS 123669 / FGSC 9596 / NRRL 45880 / 77-13-4) TaxID=660122 RepID=C7ZR91_FUSV7|nr:uncharacterized protein NECHADRAFT_98482 [Fusarium vanettenii 77-13-4]EEU33466.1 hypothetical protein NECHADRAFT_98482 [Fusarium vanettenii 77-13-4]